MKNNLRNKAIICMAMVMIMLTCLSVISVSAASDSDKGLMVTWNPYGDEYEAAVFAVLDTYYANSRCLVANDTVVYRDAVAQPYNFNINGRYTYYFSEQDADGHEITDGDSYGETASSKYYTYTDAFYPSDEYAMYTVERVVGVHYMNSVNPVVNYSTVTLRTEITVN